MLDPTRVKIAPSLLGADVSRVAEEIAAVESAGGDWLHMDVMDGHFVPNLTFGPVVIAAAQRCTTLPIDVQLMVDNPMDLLEAYVQAGGQMLSIHVESQQLDTPAKLKACIDAIHAAGAYASVAVNPDTPIDRLRPVLGDVEMVLIMSVRPGFCGQQFMPVAVDKVRAIRQVFAGEIEVDGGVGPETAPACIAAGASVLVAGNAVFGQPDYAAAIRDIRGETV